MKELFKALGQFREQVSAVKKDADNPFYKSKYADLNSILEVIKNPLLISGLAISHNCKHTESGFIVVTTLAHIESGEHIESEFPVFGNKPQEIWSSMSYARRYNLLALLDIPTEDDDGQKANEAPRTQKEVKPYAKQQDEFGLDLDDYIASIAMEKDSESLKLLYTRGLKLCISEKQKDFFTSLKDKQKKVLWI